ncbi:MAG: rhomboid family intramembrane serine protease [Clostridia bacterium]|nr:rhomboid family intramembrane serine protease [Clostridia bacterium]MBQ5355343.1 rhomboid family intramembrane serine protease [Clostridia bacterium]
MKKLKITFNSPAVLCFALVSGAALVLNRLTGGAANRLVFSTYRASLLSPLTWIRFFTHALGHSGWQHYIGNMSYLLLLGPMLEEKYGSKKLVGVMAAAAGVTGIANFVLFPHTALCGASGIVFAFILLTSFTGFREGELPVTVILVAVIFIGQQIFEGLFVQNNVSNLSHILGGVVGAAVGYVFNRKRR